MSINKVILIGRLGKDPEVKTLENGTKRASFSLATNEFYRDKEGNKIENTEWHNIICWRNLAEIAEKYLTKGKLIYVEGKIKTRSWEENGAKRYITEIEANTFTMLGLKSEEGGDRSPEERIGGGPAVQMPEASVDDIDPTDDLPF
ncbi:MAG TPA: single-stranded DNA-binding protein [Bacteroidales bacterium]|jgi:single-strand DNA-binding protein|nr:single-stranded DNA-binding protein [Bacteroidales bacterium]HOS58372.1 single-stranded DNA-binding protein [Bacteroidales bacterium]HPY81403.1 single-stranded DNA-binding protein [Bacteroidales bacterium]HQA87242.1 single-stranded DNA-binding protein [Bacteroidales bacterium]HRT14386.1 single-stranded DNA-binding protein [Bacteroidales bacterium]